MFALNHEIYYGLCGECQGYFINDSKEFINKLQQYQSLHSAVCCRGDFFWDSDDGDL